MPVFNPPLFEQIGGNTTGTTALVRSGTLTLAGGNNITLSQAAGNAITIIGGSVGGIAAVVGTGGNTTGTTILIQSGTLTLVGGNNITLSQASGNAITIIGAGGGANVGVSSIGNTSGSTGMYSTGNFVLAGGNNITLSQSTDVGGATLTISGGAGGGGIAMSLSGNSTSAGAGYSNITSGTAILAGGNNVTLSQNGATITISAASQSLQTSNVHNLTLAGNSTSAGAGHIQVSSGTLTLAGGNNITLSQNGNAVTIFAAQHQLVGMSNIGNTSGTSSAFSTGRMVFAGGNNITLSQATDGNGGTITISAFTQTVQTQNLHNVSLGGNTAGVMAQVSSGTLTLAGGNNITLSQNGNAITISGGAGGGGVNVGLSNIGNTSGDTAMYGTGNVVFAGGNNITLSQSTNAGGATVTISAGAGGGGIAVSLSGNNTTGTLAVVSTGTLYLAGNNLTLSQNGNSITINNPFLTIYEPYPFHGTGTGAVSCASNTSAPMSLYRFNVTEGCLAEYVKVVMSMSFITGGTSAYSQSGTLLWGIYSNGTGTNVSRMSLIGSSSLSYAVSYSNSSITINQATTTHASGVYSTGNTNSSGLNISSGYTGLKMFLLGLNSTITKGDYWLGIYHRNSSSSFNSGIRMSLYGLTHTVTGLAPMGSFSSAFSTGTNVPGGLGGNWFVGHGSYSLAGLTSLAGDITMSQITQNVGLIPYMKFESRV